MFGALCGGLSAYWLERYRERTKKTSEQFSALVRSQFALIVQLNTLSNIKIQFLDRYRNDEKRELRMIRFNIEDSKLRVAYDSIAFLASTDANTLLSVQLAEQSYVAAVSALASRNNAFDFLHENTTVMRGDPQTGRMTLATNDPRPLKLLKDTTDSLYNTVDKACERLKEEIAQLRTVGKKLYPKKKFLKIEPPAKAD